MRNQCGVPRHGDSLNRIHWGLSSKKWGLIPKKVGNFMELIH